MIAPAKNAQTEKRCEDCGGAFVAGRFARFCPRCRPLQRETRRLKYRRDGETLDFIRRNYDGRIRGRAKQIARRIGWPTWMVKRMAMHLGLCRPAGKDRRPWTTEEIKFLQEWAGLRSTAWIAKKLKRGRVSICLKMKRMQLSQRVANGYALRNVADCFGVDYHTIERWVEKGWLRPTLPGSHRQNPEDKWCRFHEDEIRKFVRMHPLEPDLKKVDPVWFIGLLLGSPNIDIEHAL